MSIKKTCGLAIAAQTELSTAKVALTRLERKLALLEEQAAAETKLYMDGTGDAGSTGAAAGSGGDAPAASSMSVTPKSAIEAGALRTRIVLAQGEVMKKESSLADILTEIVDVERSHEATWDEVRHFFYSLVLHVCGRIGDSGAHILRIVGVTARGGSLACCGTEIMGSAAPTSGGAATATSAAAAAAKRRRSNVHSTAAIAARHAKDPQQWGDTRLAHHLRLALVRFRLWMRRSTQRSEAARSVVNLIASGQARCILCNMTLCNMTRLRGVGVLAPPGWWSAFKLCLDACA